MTIGLTRQTLENLRVLADRRAIFVSALIAEQIEILVEKEEAYERVRQQVMALLDQGFHMGGVIRADRDELHER